MIVGGLGLAMDLRTLFGTIKPGSREGVMSVANRHIDSVTVPEWPGYHLGRDQSGHPVLLVEQRPGVSAAPPLVLENLSVEHDVPCTIVSDVSQHRRVRATIVRCTSSDPDLHDLFLHVVESLIVVLGTEPTDASIHTVIAEVIALFRKLAVERPLKSLQGLWAELFLMAQARRPDILAGAWHITPVELWDFNAGPQRLEVKSSGSDTRKHRFSLPQLLAPTGATVLVASISVRPAAQGLTVMDILRDLKARLNQWPHLSYRVDQVAASTLGSGWAEAFSTRFDLEVAKESVAFFASQTIPSPHSPLPSGVSDVHFVSDLSYASPLAADRLRAMDGLVAAAQRR